MKIQNLRNKIKKVANERDEVIREHKFRYKVL